IYGEPSDHLTAFAVTGTNGKTTTVYLLCELLALLGERTGLIGTVEMRSGDRVLPAGLTTPQAVDLQAILATMVADGVTALAMEVSSHALELHRVAGVKYAVAGFTNLSQDHLDFHQTMDSYFAAKAKLFTPEFAERGVVSVDGPWGRKLMANAAIPLISLATDYGDAGRNMVGLDWYVSDIAPFGSGSRFTLTELATGFEIQTSTDLPGSFNVQNAALAIVMVLASGMPRERVREAVMKGVSPTVPGRMEVIAAGDNTTPRVIVDFAHNTEALREALESLRGSSPRRLMVLFGAAGERDQGKRPAMGAAATELADVVYLTDDDPHEEDPAAIREAVRLGAEEAQAAAAAQGRKVEVIEIPERRAAIREVILAAAPGDTVLLAGRGHETTQPVGTADVPLDDRVEARAALASRMKRLSK
ncbi:MAG: UDP-N-acetylmuramoyl-L-alanyl-D-glutamate--2,6-diaminopimelate ligase, partial [Promicromonosporaceae bacterium]|nr:UDP-N-acetylmuramoyl-L-alanyl-D-glutamate--2,6-diaminopimelate ligase [Promicromonosporaceae bacterium]